MFSRALALTALVPLAFAVACGDDDTTGVNNGFATARFVNVTNSSVDVANGGTIGSSNLAFGGQTSCMSVNANGGTGLAFNQAGTSTPVSGFSQSFASGGNYTVVAYPSATGATQFLTLNNTFTPTSGQAGLRIVNAASGSGNLVAVGNGSTLGTGTGVGFGTSGNFMSVNSGSQALTFNTGTGTSTVASAGTLNLAAGQNYTLIVAPPSSGTTSLRTILVPSC
jgi:Domain of unknown function (DUF4397)